MVFGWTDEQLERYESAKALGTRISESLTDRPGGEQSFDRAHWKAIGDSGILSAALPSEFGGLGLDVQSVVLMLEGLGYGCRDNGLTLAVNGTIWAVQDPIRRFGSSAQKARWLRALGTGDAIGCHAMTERASGSDAFSLSSTAQKKSGGYVINGEKAFVGMAPVSDVTLAFARTDQEAGPWGISAFLIDVSTEGVTLGEPVEKMGLMGNPMGAITFHDCWVPETSLLGSPGAGVAVFNETMEWERSFIFASHVGAMARQLDEAVAYANEREQFGLPIGKNQSVSNRIVDMKLRLETARLLLYQAASIKEAGLPAPIEAALTKLHISESFVTSSIDAIRIHGGKGYLIETGAEKELRDSVGGLLYSGTSDMQRQVVARLLGL